MIESTAASRTGPACDFAGELDGESVDEFGDERAADIPLKASREHASAVSAEIRLAIGLERMKRMP
jgi:hypothetical protein